MTTSGPTKNGISFGPFTLLAGERLLIKEGTPVELGARALDILVALISTPNEVISKQDLMSRVWPDVTVEEGSLRFHMASLRKTLGDGKDGARYIATLAGRGYCFVAPVSRASSPHDDVAPAASFLHANLPSRLTRMVGRDDDVLQLSDELTSSRLVTIVGAGGVGKTTVAVAVAHHLVATFGGSVLFVDLGMVSDPKLAATAVASMLGLSVHTDDATPGLIAFLKNKRILLILDTCEHLVEAVAALATSIMQAAPQVRILATSREILRIDGERVFRLAALLCPPDVPGLTAAAVASFPATQLFVERAVASGASLNISDEEAPIVANICRRLDGVALAIELAARRVESHGLQQTAALLDQRLTLLWLGSRTAPPRQKTLQATLDWSYELLSELERVVLRRLAVFVGYFMLDAALEVVTSATLDQSSVFDAFDSLVAKSMVATRPIGAMMRYRLLDTTRAYARDISNDGAEAAELAARHAAYYWRWLEQVRADWPTSPSAAERSQHDSGLQNVRAALEWSFGAKGDAEIGVRLASAAAPVFLAMSLPAECHRWSERAIGALDHVTRGGTEEMHLQAALGMSLMFTRGMSEAARLALCRGLAVAEERGDALHQLQLLAPLTMFHVRSGDYRTALRYAERSYAVSLTLNDSAAFSLSRCLLGLTHHLIGELGMARTELEAALQRTAGARWTGALFVGFDHHLWAGIALARTLWLLGYPAQAAERVRQTVKEAESTGHPVTISIVLNWTVSVFLWLGDMQSAEEHNVWFLSHAESHSLGPYLAVGRGHKGELAITQGDAGDGVEILQGCLAELHAAHYELLTTAFNCSLVQGLAATGRIAEGLGLIDATIRGIEVNGDLTYMPEALRVKAGLLRVMPQPGTDDPEKYLMQSLDMSRNLGARAWQLRTATDLAVLWSEQGRPEIARDLLQQVIKCFGEGLDTADVKAAKRVLAALG